MEKEPDFCPECKKVVRLDDPSRVLLGRIPFHRACLGKVEIHAREINAEIQVWFRGNNPEVHYDMHRCLV